MSLFRPKPKATPQGYEDVQVVLFNGEILTLQRINEDTAVLDGVIWNEVRPGFWKKGKDYNDYSNN